MKLAYLCQRAASCAIVLVLFLLLIPNSAWSLESADNHTELWLSMLGMSNSSTDPVGQRLKEISSLIDDVKKNAPIEVRCGAATPILITSPLLLCTP
jgi:hypothetical protein